MFVLFSSKIFCQNDSIVKKSIVARHASEIIPATGKTFKVTSLEAKMEKGRSTFVPIISRKSIHGISGHQFGLAYYRKWKWGYAHSDIFYSSSLIFPKLVLRSNVFVKLFDGMEINVGGSTVAYADGNRLNVFKFGGSYYYKSLIASYTMRIPLSGYVYHSLFLRKYMNIGSDYLQINLSSGPNNEGLRLAMDQPFKVYALRFSMFKTILRKTQIQVALGLTRAMNESTSNDYFNYSIGLKREI